MSWSNQMLHKYTGVVYGTLITVFSILLQFIWFNSVLINRNIYVWLTKSAYVEVVDSGLMKLEGFTGSGTLCWV